MSASPSTANTNRVAIVTGAAEGIGRAIALKLAKDGLDLGLFDLPHARDNLEELADCVRREHGARVVTVYGDVSVEEDVKRLVDTVVEDLGSLYAMIANAGIACSMKPLHELPTETFDKLSTVNTRGTFLCYKYAAIQLIKQGQGGRMVAASSVGGKQGIAGLAGYCATKFAIRGLTQSAALDYGAYGITVNAYTPGATETAMAHRWDEELSATLGAPRGSFMHELSLKNALQRNGKAGEVANLVSFLVSDDAAFITGQSYRIDGGYSFD